ncbi:MAG: hypothetical protein JO092_06420, partial [Candidatus Eremiobacteraeota bacterium]|nr:hypothetical protein [Candidatus Eremiobacteraeota bacterium]
IAILLAAGFENLTFRSIGPAIAGGRVAAVAGTVNAALKGAELKQLEGATALSP